MFVAWSALVVAGVTQGSDEAWHARLEGGQAFWEAWTHLGDTLVLMVATVAVVAWFLLHREPHTARRFLVTMVITWGLILALKLLVARERPPGAMDTGFSYPSGHTTGSLVFFPLLARLHRAPRGVEASMWLLGATLGISRLALGVHYVSDVVGGWLLAASIVAWASPGGATK